MHIIALLCQVSKKMTHINIIYLRSRVRQLRHARTEGEYQELLEKIAHHLNIPQSGERLTFAHKQEVFIRLRQLGINANRTAPQR
jgi:hypothetical protein